MDCNLLQCNVLHCCILPAPDITCSIVGSVVAKSGGTKLDMSGGHRGDKEQEQSEGGEIRSRGRTQLFQPTASVVISW